MRLRSFLKAAMEASHKVAEIIASLAVKSTEWEKQQVKEIKKIAKAKAPAIKKLAVKKTAKK